MNSQSDRNTNPPTGTHAPAIVWFRNDLRLCDNPALMEAVGSGRPVLPVYVHDTVSPGIRVPGAAQNWMLHQSLEAIDASLRSLGSRLVILQGAAEKSIADLVAETGAAALYWNRRYGPGEIAIDTAIKKNMGEAGLDVRSFQGSLLHEPSQLRTGAGEPYRVYSPFWRALEKTGEPRTPFAAPESLPMFEGAPQGVALASLGLLPENEMVNGGNWTHGLQQAWPVGEAGARQCLVEFIDNGLHGYADGRDLPARRNVSRLSPYLRFGLISPWQAWHAARSAQAAGTAPARDVEKFLKELGWREFSYHLLYHYPSLTHENFNARFDDFPWTINREMLDAWKRGQTGYPIVDAGMRELWQTGYMHNRIRMVAASFLIKHLLIDWREGEAWFWDTLVDGDPANNPASWQWVAGSGADAAPYFRVFNPIIQGRKFDSDGEYVRRWVPEIAGLDTRYLHSPWEAPGADLAKAGIRLGETYPHPVVDHQMARDRALSAFQELKKAA